MTLLSQSQVRRQEDSCMTLLPDMNYDGQVLDWRHRGTFRATSGLPGRQSPELQCVPEAGPLPEGLYALGLEVDRKPARDDGHGDCRLIPSPKLQTIPRGAAAGVCEQFWTNWGVNRVGLKAANVATRNRCKPRRDGFYLHDSTKGYSHGCIEVEGSFFVVLRSYIGEIQRRQSRIKNQLLLEVRYVQDRQTSGGTKR
jgi:hypothetical protein